MKPANHTNHLGYMLKMICFWMVSTLLITAASGQQTGCTDPLATNFDSSAVIPNGSCLYAQTQYRPTLKARLKTTLTEISGIIFFDGRLLALNDGGGGNKLYFVDSSTGLVQQTITVGGATNIDWEELSQDSSHIYIGDFGNNGNGNRKNLCIYKIPRQTLLQPGDFEIPADSIQKIFFSYPDQVDFTPTGSNNTAFDCEAMVIRRGAIHLFSKNWIGGHSTHYQLSTDSGTQVAQKLDSLATGSRLITGASLGADDMLILTSYTPSGSCALYLVYGFGQSNAFFETGNKRRFDLPGFLTTGQLEAICMVNATYGFLGSEAVSFTSPKLWSFQSLDWILPFYRQNPQPLAEPGMVRYNTTLNKFEVFNSEDWEGLD